MTTGSHLEFASNADGSPVRSQGQIEDGQKKIKSDETFKFFLEERMGLSGNLIRKGVFVPFFKNYIIADNCTITLYSALNPHIEKIFNFYLLSIVWLICQRNSLTFNCNITIFCSALTSIRRTLDFQNQCTR